MLQDSLYSNQEILKITQAGSIVKVELLQNLWAGYGSLYKYYLIGGQLSSVIVKKIKLTNFQYEDIGHLRKIKSYHVEQNFYENYAKNVVYQLKIPNYIGSFLYQNILYLLLEDLHTIGNIQKSYHSNESHLLLCLEWLANFHAYYVNSAGVGLWEVGTYWHLATRPLEYENLPNGLLKDNAVFIDQQLNNAHFKTLVHGDPKLDNFLFNNSFTNVAAVDFQYVGKGCGMKDVVYLMMSFFSDDICEKKHQNWLNFYFLHLTKKVKLWHPNADVIALETEWRDLFSWAWIDFYRFYKGWTSINEKQHLFSEKLVNQLLSDSKL